MENKSAKSWATSIVLTCSLMTLVPVAIFVYAPNSWPYIILKVIAAFIFFGAIQNSFKAKNMYGDSGPGYVLNAILFFGVLYSDNFIIRFACSFLMLIGLLTVHSMAKATHGPAMQRINEIRENSGKI
jgi:hypothetical protein